MTGAQFWSYLQQKIDKAYSAYLDNAKANALIKESLFRMVDKFWRGLSYEAEADEMMSFIVREESITPSLGVIKLSTLLPNYMHILHMTATYEMPIEVTAVSGTTLTAVNHKLRKGSIVKFGVTEYTVNKVKGNTFDLGVTGLSTGTYYQIKEKSLGHLQSDRKTSPFHRATEENPKYIPQTDGTSTPRSFKIEPSTNLAGVSVDYIQTPPQEIDVADTTIDLEDYYASKFLYRLMDECVVNFGTQSKDYNTRQFAQQDIIENP
jgi:hypothetical protein